MFTLRTAVVVVAVCLVIVTDSWFNSRSGNSSPSPSSLRRNHGNNEPDWARGDRPQHKARIMVTHSFLYRV
ncbi:hypothetical protein Pcinc_007496 [Petrolisthes cinctipes]|uniref:Uncharacterized protein n=1 Tax=Petrolisthes cinctipes TaxID=88211 RepID=A0AAE1GAT8_PETCI|nr:hypothetical protein Pcinc_007496 [Petrolisthes cinctipes]